MTGLYRCILIFGLFLCGCSPQGRSPVKHVNLESLLSRMTNTATFAEAPLGESFLESSYDRSGGNQDWAVYTKTEANGRIKIFEASGPGYISRIWIASFYADRWLFFFDGESEPRLALSKDELFGGKFPFSPPLAGQSGGGRYSLLPIPFSKSIRIEVEPAGLSPGNRNYFQINYTRLAVSSASVESFPEELSSSQSNRVTEVNAFQAGLPQIQETLMTACLDGVGSRPIPSGGSLVFWEDEGPGVLKTLCLHIDSPSAGQAMGDDLLRRLRLRMFWDRNSEPSVDVPLGDFFCNPFYFRKFSSMPLGQSGETFICQFPMPYRKGARCELVNDSKVPVSVSIGAQGNRESNEGLTRKFHAAWKAQQISGIPFRMLSTSGSGHYVGCFLSALAQDGTWTMLEGDEYVRPDSGRQPPQLGTGLEDYFNGAYYYTSLFDLSLQGLIEKGAMRTDQYRLHLLDAVDFKKTFESGFEFGDQNRARGYMSGVTYWYADKASAAPLPASQTYLLARPGDRFELPGLMAQLFLLERAGLYADAAVRMEYFADRYRQQAWCDRLRVRAVGYRELVEGFAAVKADYERLSHSEDAPAAQAARDQLWLAEDPSHALLGIHSLGKYTLFQDGTAVMSGDNSRPTLEVLRIPVTPGAHEWKFELEPTHQGSFFSLCLRTHWGDVTSVGDWKILDVTPLPGRPPLQEVGGRQVLPNMGVWAFEPNGYVGMQSPACGIQSWTDWDNRPLYKRVVIEKSFSVGPQAVSEKPVEKERSSEELRARTIE